MPNVRTLLVILVVALVITIGFSFTLIGMLGEATAALALLGLLARGIQHLVRRPRGVHSLGSA